MNVIYGATRNLYPYLKGAITSLLEHNKDVTLYILAEDDELPYDLPCKHHVINVSGQTYFKPGSPNWNSIFTYMAMMRICTPEIIRAKKLLWLDVDTIVCDSLQPLWDIDMTGKWIAWCPERCNTYRPFGRMYYNIGVCVLNLQQMRKDGVTPILVDMLNKERFWCTDQCAMNKITPPEKMVEIDVRYNESFCCGYTDNPAIVHYAGVPDWYRNNTMKRLEYRKKYE